jgi:predicted restriction endonuclease
MKRKLTSRKTLSNKLDKLFSEKVRAIGRCEKCGKTTTLQCSHVYNRSHKWLRWDLENGICLCAGCHFFWWHQEPAEAIRWAMTKRNFDYLDKLRQINKPMKEFDMQEIYEKLKLS